MGSGAYIQSCLTAVGQLQEAMENPNANLYTVMVSTNTGAFPIN